jgi:predicted amidophosphoribosyltransferase
VDGKRVHVIDDAYTEGLTLRETARMLREAGAVEVAGLVLVRRKGT